MVSLGIIGCGTVGSAIAKSYIEHTDVKCYDIDPTKSTHKKEEVLKQDVLMLCLPTQPTCTGVCDTSVLLKHFHDKSNFHPCTVIRSTVPIGFTTYVSRHYWKAYHSPEFLTARCAYTDACTPTKNVIGIPTQYKLIFNIATDKLARLYNERFGHVPVGVVTSETSEAIKLVTNSFFAAKVSLFNEFRTITKNLGADWFELIGLLRMDNRINASHTQVPGPDGNYGFGGDCLPKDIATLADQGNYESIIMKSVIARNKKDRHV